MTAMTKVNELAHTASTEMSDLVTAIDRAPEKEMSGTKLTKEEQKELFGDGFNDGYADEAEQRWGESEARKQSQKRTSKYTKAEWAEIKAEMDATNAAFVSAMADGEPATSERAMDAAEQHRLERPRMPCPPPQVRGTAYLAVGACGRPAIGSAA